MIHACEKCGGEFDREPGQDWKRLCLGCWAEAWAGNGTEAMESYLDMVVFWEQQDIESVEQQKMADLQERFLAEAKAVLGHV